jgi:ADP-dependent NAD(P)H-hydrate dehydratase / NAD(P)H-hydrate epimerase
MKGDPIPSHPIVTVEEVRTLEAGLFHGEERKEWAAMLQAGTACAEAIRRDYAEAGTLADNARLLVLAGKGNNAGDALIAARVLLQALPEAEVDVVFAFGPRKLGPLAARSWRALVESARGRVRAVGPAGLAPAYAVAIDGIFGFQFRPPLPPEALAAIAAAAACDIRFRAAVDLPSGLGEAGGFAADFTYATGAVKAPLLGCKHAGRPRYLDLGFFAGAAGGGPDRVLLSSLLAPLAGLRPAGADKRSQGHLVLVGGSGGFPGAILMSTLAALQSGVGLVTACVPHHLVAGYAARAPEAMWVGLPVTASGALSLAGKAKVLKAAEKATALAMGSGLGRDPSAHALMKAIARGAQVPLVIDADALQPDIVRTGRAPRILTPHAGELKRIAEGADLRRLCRALPAVVIAKGPVTRVSDGGTVYHSFFGGPVLSRGGSGDLLAGLTGGLLAQTPADPLLAATRAAVWHGMAADQLARAKGQTPVQILQWLDFLAPALRESAPCPAT